MSIDVNELRSWQLQGLCRTTSAHMAFGSFFWQNNHLVSIIVAQILRPVAARIDHPRSGLSCSDGDGSFSTPPERRLDEWRWACIRAWEMFGAEERIKWWAAKQAKRADCTWALVLGAVTQKRSFLRLRSQLLRASDGFHCTLANGDLQIKLTNWLLEQNQSGSIDRFSNPPSPCSESAEFFFFLTFWEGRGGGVCLAGEDPLLQSCKAGTTQISLEVRLVYLPLQLSVC